MAWTRLGIPCLSGFVVREDGSMRRVESLEQGGRLVRLADLRPPFGIDGAPWVRASCSTGSTCVPQPNGTGVCR